MLLRSKNKLDTSINGNYILSLVTFRPCNSALATLRHYTAQGLQVTKINTVVPLISVSNST